MSEMLDRVEMAIDRCGQERGCRVHPSLAKHFARAVLEAMREPTAAMIEGADAYDRKTDQWCASGQEHWDAMIDAALKD